MATTNLIRQSVGIDVSKKTLSVCLSNLEQGLRVRIRSTKNFPNTFTGFKKLDSWISSLRKDSSVPFCLVMEATGVYYEDAAYFLKAKDWEVCVLLPNRAKAYAKSLAHKSKTDVIDAKIPAQLALERSLPAWEPPRIRPFLSKSRNSA